MLGVLKAGKIYVPLDPTFPTARLTSMLADSQACVLVTNTDPIMPLQPPNARHQPRRVSCAGGGWVPLLGRL